MIETKNVCKSELCTGCAGCYNVCPSNAIVMKEDASGFSYPIITEACTKCGLCRIVCPAINPVTKQNPILCFAAYSKQEFPKKTTSGGIASLLYRYVLLSGGIGYGVYYDKDKKRFEYKRATNSSEAIEFSGSKYVQADVNQIYRKVKNDLNSKKLVLFVGTPCQIAGLRSFLRKEYNNLLLVDIICHGVPSQKMLFDSLNIQGIDNIKSFSFRDGKNYVLSYKLDDTISISIDSYHSRFYEAFSLGKTLRISCHDCQYASSLRVGDITIGDYWGLGMDSILYNRQQTYGGVSLLILNNEKGSLFFDKIKDNLQYESRNIQEAISGNTQLRFPVADTRESKQFRYLYQTTNDFNLAVIKSRNIRQRLSSIYIIHKFANYVRKIKGIIR